MGSSLWSSYQWAVRVLMLCLAVQTTACAISPWDWAVSIGSHTEQDTDISRASKPGHTVSVASDVSRKKLSSENWEKFASGHGRPPFVLPPVLYALQTTSSIHPTTLIHPACLVNPKTNSVLWPDQLLKFLLTSLRGGMVLSSKGAVSSPRSLSFKLSWKSAVLFD